MHELGSIYSLTRVHKTFQCNGIVELSFPVIQSWQCWQLGNFVQLLMRTRIHSSTMCTIHCSSHLPEGMSAQGVFVWEGVCPGGGSVCLGGFCPGDCTPPWTEFLTHARENITFPQLRLRIGSGYQWNWLWYKFTFFGRFELEQRWLIIIYV